MPITTCASLETLRTEIDTARKKVILDETEDTWDTIAQGIIHLTHLCNSGGCDFPSEMVTGIRSMSRPLNSALNSERSRLSGAAIALLTALSTELGPSFEHLVPQFIPTLLALCGRTNKVFTSRARTCIRTIIQQTRLPSLLPYLADLASHKSVFLRLTAAEAILACLNCFNPPDLEKETRAHTVEEFIKSTACDASADVRKTSKEIFKAYQLLLPARVDNFVAPLTPVVKKYLDIQIGPSGIHTAGQKQTSRPSSRANNIVTEAGRRPTTSIVSKPSARPTIDDPPHDIRQRPVIHAPPTTADIRAPRQRTVSQMQRDPPQPRGLQINAQPSGAAQRCVIPTSVSTHQSVRHPLPSAARVPSARNASTIPGPQRPPPMQLKFNRPPDRLKPSGSGAKRVPLPPVPVNGSAGDQAAASGKSADQAGSGTIDKPHSKLPSQSSEAAVPGTSAIGPKASKAIRSAPLPAKATSGPVPTRLAPRQRARIPSEKGGLNNPSKIIPQKRQVGTVQKHTRPLIMPESKEVSPTLIPLPPSPSTPTKTPLPPSPDCTPHSADLEAQGDPALMPILASSDPAKGPSQSMEPSEERGDLGDPSTPITTLLFSIQRGFLFTPSSPLSPPQNYLPAAPGGFKQDMEIASNLAKVPSARGPFCTLLEDGSIVDSLDRHALKDLN